jgi:hypothetical protein
MKNAFDAIILSLRGLLFIISATILDLISHSLGYIYGSDAANTVADFHQADTTHKTDDLPKPYY